MGMNKLLNKATPKLFEDFGIDLSDIIFDVLNSEDEEAFADKISDLIDNSTTYKGKQYTKEQMEVIRSALAVHMNVDLIANPDYSAERMERIAVCATRSDMIDVYRLKEFDDKQVMVLCVGISEEVNISKIYDPSIPYDEMYMLVQCLKEGFDITDFITNKTSAKVISLWYQCQMKGLDYSKYEGLDEDFQYALADWLENGNEEPDFDFTGYDSRQLLAIFSCIENGIDLDMIVTPGVPWEEICIFPHTYENEGTLKDHVYLVDRMFAVEYGDAVHNIIRISEKFTEKYREYIMNFIELHFLIRGVPCTEAYYNRIMRKTAEAIGLSGREPKVTMRDGYIYTSDQLDALYTGMLRGVDPSAYAKPDFSADQINFLISACLVFKEDLSPYMHPEYGDAALDLIDMRYNDGIDLGVFTKEPVSYEHMKILYQDLVAGLDVSDYNDASLPLEEVERLSELNWEENIHKHSREIGSYEL